MTQLDYLKVEAYSALAATKRRSAEEWRRAAQSPGQQPEQVAALDELIATDLNCALLLERAAKEIIVAAGPLFEEEPR